MSSLTASSAKIPPREQRLCFCTIPHLETVSEGPRVPLLNARILHPRFAVPDGTFGSELASGVQVSVLTSLLGRSLGFSISFVTERESTLVSVRECIAWMHQHWMARAVAERKIQDVSRMR
jgi:hypothetical protein